MSKLAHSNQETMDMIEAKRIVQEEYPSAFSWKSAAGGWYVANRLMHGDDFGSGKTELAAWVNAAKRIQP